MAKPIPAYLKLLDENRLADPVSNADDSAALAELCQAFWAATGWPLRLTTDGTTGGNAESDLRDFSDSMCSAPVDPGVGIPPGRIRVGFNRNDDASAARGPMEAGLHAVRQGATEHAPVIGAALLDTAPQPCLPEAAISLAEAISGLVGQLAIARRIIRHRDAELAAGVPAEEPEQFARLLESVLRAGADACECQAAALYLLDDATTSLKLRASFGLPVERLTQAPRPLKGAIADLEALLGHAVALERASAFGPWRVPEAFAAALCVPVSSPTIPLGTLWFFSDRPRDFTDRQTNFAEVVAGRLAAELERTTLLAQTRETVPATIR